MGADKVPLTVVYIDLFSAGPDLKPFLEIFSGHCVMHLVEDKREILMYGNFFALKVFIRCLRQWEKGFLFVTLKKVMSRIAQPLEVCAVLPFHLFP